MKTKEILLTLFKAAVAIALFVIAIVHYDTLSTLSVQDLTAFTSDWRLISLIVLAIYLVKALVFVVPASLIYVAVGAILPPALAVGVNLVGIFIEVSVTYVLGRFLGKDAVYRLLSKKEAGRKLLEKRLGDNWKVLLGIRALPVFPIDWVSLFYGASGCRYPKYALASVLGLSWRVILFTIIGDGVFAWIPMDKIILIAICLLPVAAVYILVKKFVLDPRKKKREEEAKQNTPEETQ